MAYVCILCFAINQRGNTRHIMNQWMTACSVCTGRSLEHDQQAGIALTITSLGQQTIWLVRIHAMPHLLLSTGTYCQCPLARPAHAKDACAQAVCVASLKASAGPAAQERL